MDMKLPVTGLEEITRHGNERLLALIKASSDAVYRMSPDWTTMTELFGHGFLADTVEPDLNWLDKYIHPDDQPFVTDVIHGCIKDKKIFKLEHRVLRADGSIGWTFSHAAPLLDEKGNIREWFGAASDITARKNGEEALKRRTRELEEKEKEYLEIIDGSSVGSYIHDLIRGELFFSSEWKVRLGIAELSPAQVAESVYSLVHPDDVAAMQKAYTDACTRRSPKVRMEFRLWTDAGYIWILGQAKIIYDDKGSPVKYMGTHMDITERKKAEEMLAYQAHLLDEVNDAIIATDLDLAITHWNKAAERTYGWAAHEAQGLNADVLLQTDFMGANPGDLVCNLMQEGHAEVEVMQICKDGAKVNVRAKVSLIYDINGAPLGTVGVLRNITERKKAEEQLRFHSSIADYALAAIFATDVNQNVIFWNKGAETLYGWRAEEALGRNLTYLFTPIYYDDGVSRQEAVRAYMEKGWWRGEASYLHRDGFVIDVMASGCVLKDPNGNIKTFLVIHHDITELKRAEKELKTRGERERFLLELGDALRTVSNSNDIQAAVTRTAMDYFRADRCYYCEIENDMAVIRQDALRGDLPSVAGVYPLSTLPIHKGLIDAGLPFIVPDVYTTDMVDEELRQLCIQLKVISYLDVPVTKDGKPVGMLCVVQSSPRNWTSYDAELATEVAERMWTAVERTKTEAALRESEERYRAVVQNTSAIILRLDPQGIIRFANKRALEIFGYTENELIGKPALGTFVPEQETTGRDLAEMVNDIMMNPDRYHRNANENMRKGGERIWMEWTNSGIYDTEGRLIEILGVGFDSTEQKRAEKALRVSEENARSLVAELKKADQNKNQFISVLSHELRNPLAAISAGIQILDISQDIEHTRKAKEIINRQTNQLGKLVDDLLELTRITKNMITLKKEFININELIQEVVEDSGAAYQEKGVHLITEIQAEPVFLDADPVRLTQAIGNVLQNACKFTPVTGTVQLALHVDGDHIAILVKDNGIGISPDILPQLFTPFTQADESMDRQSGGLGLGLSIAKGIVELHHGSISAHSAGLGTGSTFTILLPIAEIGSLTIKEPKFIDEAQKALKILIIDDNKDFADTLCTTLSIIGHSAYVVTDGKSGIRKAMEIEPDVILCDIGLPDMKGYAVASVIKSNIHLKKAYLVAMTGYASERDKERAQKFGFDKHMAKPINFLELNKLLKDAWYTV